MYCRMDLIRLALSFAYGAYTMDYYAYWVSYYEVF